MKLNKANTIIILNMLVAGTLGFSVSSRLPKKIALNAAAPSTNDMSGGVFFDGGSDFKPSTSSQLELQKKIEASKNIQKLESTSKNRFQNVINKDIVIVGSGLAGLSAALHIVTNSDRQVTILDKEDPVEQMKKTTAGSFAAAGMLAPHSERLPSGPLLDLCLESREMYTDFVQLIESITKNCSSEASKYLWNVSKDKNNGIEPWEVGYAATGGFLAPAFAGDSVATWSPPPKVQQTAVWLDEIQVHEMEPSLHPDVIGGWWFPEDASVDARRLTCALRAACAERGVQFMWGKGCEASSLELGNGNCKGIKLEDGRILSSKSVVIANGAWMRNLLPVPITPHKGQSFSLRMPTDTEPILSRILFAQDTYIVPKSDGRIVVGATVEAGSFDPNVTPAGMMHCMSNAMQLVPGLGDLPVEETWAGLRPTTPDKGPILGRTKWDNLYIAGGYWRNGVLLAPKTGQLIGDLVINDGKILENESDELLLEAFKWDRFTVKGGGKKLAASARYAASMHPVHKRSSGLGIAASVGTELGFYSGAGAAKQEREKDRQALYGEGLSGSDDAFEKAAMLGVTDGSSFSIKKRERKVVQKEENEPDTITLDDALAQTKTSDDDDEKKSSSLDDVYEKIRQNKAKSASQVKMNEPAKKEERPDPGFRIYHVDSVTREVTEIPPYSGPLGGLNKLEENIDESKSNSESSNGYDETTFDGYQTIQKANSRATRQEELDAMRKSRQANRLKVSEIDENKIGAKKMDDF
jgi:thiazole synthase